VINPQIIEPPTLHNKLYYLAGLILLGLNKIRHSIIRAYTPRTFNILDIQKAIAYDFAVYENWLKMLKIYTGIKENLLKEKVILEIGPGPDLGIGLIMLFNGVRRYNAVDIYPLAKSTPPEFYDELFKYMIEKYSADSNTINFLQNQLQMIKIGKSDRLNYVVDWTIDMSIIGDEKVDYVFSQAVFEHFDNAEDIILKLSKFCKEGSILISEIDLRTHTRWIRDLDPLNIYRYSEFLYNLFRFRGVPNRIRPYEYKKILENNGWTKIEIIPLTIVQKEYLETIINRLAKKFRDPINQMDYLTIMLCATKKY